MRTRVLCAVMIVCGCLTLSADVINLGLAVDSSSIAVTPNNVGTNVYRFATPVGATTSGPVNAQALFTVNNGSITILLSDFQADPGSVINIISGLDFVLSTGQTSGTIGSSSGQEITVNSNAAGGYVLGPTVSTGWGVNNNVSGGLELNALGFIGPEHLIIGPPNGSNAYASAGGSIAGNGPHNPFLNQSATFTVNVTGVTTSSVITGATFLFGTSAGTSVTGQLQSPEPGSLLLIGTGLLGVGGLLRRKRA